jgi:acyl-CoA synthetase (AMP-forming)/AMP-acid ligase II
MGAGLRFGQRVVMMPRFEPVSFLEAIQKHRCSVAPLVPPIIAFLAKHPLVAKYDVSSMRAIMSGAAPLDAETHDACERALGNGMRVRQGYGLTETSPVTNLAPFGFDSATADLTAAKATVVGIEAINFNFTTFAEAKVDLTNVRSGTVTVNQSQVAGSANATFNNIGGATAKAGTGITGTVTASFVAGSTAAIDAGGARLRLENA